jgi:Zn-dependent protease
MIQLQNYLNYKQYKIGKYTTSNIEIKHILIAWLVVSLAFGIVDAKGIGTITLNGVAFMFFAALIAVGSGFLFHEMAHKLVAQRYGCWAEFRADFTMLGIAVLMSFMGFVFAAPGAVMIGGGHVDVKRNGKISIAGPWTNFVLAILFMVGNIILPNMIFSYGFLINAWLGLFNMIPFGFFDGAKIWRWSIPIWVGTVAIGVILILLRFS